MFNLLLAQLCSVIRKRFIGAESGAGDSAEFVTPSPLSDAATFTHRSFH